MYDHATSAACRFTAILTLAGVACGGGVLAIGDDAATDTAASEPAPFDATVDAPRLGASPGSPAGEGSSSTPTTICAAGCLCFSTPDACAANRCTLASFVETDGARAFTCANGPLNFICETAFGG